MRDFAITLWSTVLLISLSAGTLAQAGQGRQLASIPQGTQIQVRLLDQLDTGRTQSGQTFSATVAQPVVVGGQTILARGAKLTGRVTDVVSSGRLKRPASITLELGTLRTEPLRIDGKSHLLRNVALIGGGTAAGAAVGGATGGKKGAAVGAAVGAGAGTAVAYLTGKNEIVLPAETALNFVAAGGGGAKTAAALSRSEAEVQESAESFQGGERGGRVQQVREAAAAVIFSERDQDVIRNYYRGGRGLPPGLAKKGKLPPGLAKQLRRNGSLPPGLQKRYGATPFPVDLGQQLPPLPAGYSRVILAGRALLLDRNNRILDLMALVR